ncbi:MAG: ComEC/Rec2 family competence protein [Alphaproteobacteria bacterium]
MFVGISISYNLSSYIVLYITSLITLTAVGLYVYNFKLHNDKITICVRALLFVLLGITVMEIRNNTIVKTDTLSRGMYEITGDVEKFNLGKDKNKVIITNIEISGVKQTGKVQLNTTKYLRTGDNITVTAFVFPPSKPVVKGAFDFSKYAKYKGIIGYGKILSINNIVKADDTNTANKIVDYVYQNIDPRTASLASALITGNRAGIAKDDLSALRKSGLAHLLAISGLHIGLVMGAVYFFLKTLFVLLLFNRSTLYPIKKIAGVLSLIVAFLYAGLADFPIPTIRAFLMAGIVILGVVFDRQVVNIRTVAIVAGFIALLIPESIFSPSFQLSFIAVFSLVGMFQVYKLKLKGIKGIILGVIVSSIIVQIATAPFIIYHFGLFSSHSVLANVMAIPFMTFFIAPMLLLSVLEMFVFGTSVFINISSFGLGILLDLSHFITNLDYSNFYLPSFSGVGLALFAFAVVLFIVSKVENNKFFTKCAGVVGISVVAISLLPLNKPLVYVVDKNTVLVKDGDVYKANKKVGSFVSTAIFRQTGLKVSSDMIENDLIINKIFITMKKDYICNANNNYKVIIATNSLIKNCSVPSIDRTDLYFEKGGFQIEDNYKITPNRN